MACVHHPGSATAVSLYGKDYCSRCRGEIGAAAATLDQHVTPRDCFVWYANAHDRWQPISGTGCAHYVSHQKGIRIGTPGQQCLAGYTYRVPMVIIGRAPVPGGVAAVQVNDIWVSGGFDHTGVVSRIDQQVPPQPAPPQLGQPAVPVQPPVPVVWITHASSHQHRLATDRFDAYFHSAGNFFR